MVFIKSKQKLTSQSVSHLHDHTTFHLWFSVNSTFTFIQATINEVICFIYTFLNEAICFIYTFFSISNKILLNLQLNKYGAHTRPTQNVGNLPYNH